MSKRNRVLAVILVAVLMVTGFIMPEKATGAGLALTATDLWMSAWAAYCASHGMANTFQNGGIDASVGNPMPSADVTDLVEDLIDRYANANNLQLTLENWAQLLESSLSVTANTGLGTVLHVASGGVGMFDAFADWLLGSDLGMTRTESGFSHSGGSFGDVSVVSTLSIDGVDGVLGSPGLVLSDNCRISTDVYSGALYLWSNSAHTHAYALCTVPQTVYCDFWRGYWSGHASYIIIQSNASVVLNGITYYIGDGNLWDNATTNLPVLQNSISTNTTVSGSSTSMDLGATDANAGVIGIPDTTDQDYAPDAISVPLNQPWDDAYAGENGLVGALQGIMNKVRSNTIALAGEGTDDPGGDSSSDPDDYQALGLADVFPFCLPFDLYNFFSCLAADPVAPSFEIPINFPPLNYSYTFEIDLSSFNTVAAILRKMELLGFCVALILISRQKLLRG